jgi:hypothetical protein
MENAFEQAEDALGCLEIDDLPKKIKVFSRVNRRFS